MPLFDFHCPQCDRTSELLVRADAQPHCPQCGRQPLLRLVAKPAAPATSQTLIATARRRAQAEGHFSNY
jgi:putative FmdB family regulatory protein